MMLDRTLSREIKALAGDGSREAKFSLLHRIDEAVKDMSTAAVRDTFNVIIRKHGRAVVAVCVAETLDTRKDRIDRWGLRWAQEVLALLPGNFTPGNRERAYIRDHDLHPTAICGYAAGFIRLTSEEDLP